MPWWSKNTVPQAPPPDQLFEYSPDRIDVGPRAGQTIDTIQVAMLRQLPTGTVLINAYDGSTARVGIDPVLTDPDVMFGFVMYGFSPSRAPNRHRTYFDRLRTF